MKKFYILMVVLFMVSGASGQGSIPVLLNDSSSHSNHSQFNLQHLSLQSMKNVQGTLGKKEWKTSDIFVEKKSKEQIKHKIPEQRSLIQIYDSIYGWNWDISSTGWKINSKTTNIVYDANFNLTSEIYQAWNGSAWVNTQKYSCTYDANNNLTSEFGQTWNGSAWVNLYLYNYTYDANNNCISELDQTWNGSVWVNSMLLTYTYNSNNNLTSELYQNWNGSAWENSYQYIFTYDANNNPTSELFQSWNGSNWENQFRWYFTYDANNNLISLLLKGWNGSAWENLYRSVYTYGANNNLTSRLFQSWDSNAWMKDALETFSYDANNNLTNELYQTWNGNSWVNYFQDIFNYDVNDFLVSVSYKNWDDYGIIIESGDSAYYYFHTVGYGINDDRSSTSFLMIYPNPSSTEITIETSAIPNQSQLSIMNLNGQELIIHKITKPKTQLDISSLSSGVYLVKVVSEKGLQVGKFIKK